MTVIIAQDNPDAIRGVLKRWFIEPKPNVFVGSINASVKDAVLAYILNQARGIRLLIISSSNNCQGYELRQVNDPDYGAAILDGVEIIATRGECDCPF